MPTTLTRTVSFFALHRLYRPEWSSQQNQETRGPLSDEPPHGRRYSCAVTVRGGPHAPADVLVDLAQLDRILEEEVVQPEDPSLYADCTGLA